MSKRRYRPAVKVACFVLILVFAVACGSLKGPRKHFWEIWKPRAPEVGSIYPVPPEVDTPPPVTDTELPGDVSPLPIEGLEATEAQARETMGIPEPEPIRQAATLEVAELPIIYFAFDSSVISPEDLPLLDRASDWLMAHPDVQVQIEGHCDERGTREYNLNLGQRRANAVKEYLVSKGIDSNRLHTISYGEERPMELGHDEEAYAKNRRVQFLVY